jgi:hypothetical protein
MVASEDASDSSSSELTSRDFQKAFIKAFFFFLLKEVFFFEEEEGGGETLEIGEASFTGRKTSGVKRVGRALGSKFWAYMAVPYFQHLFTIEMNCTSIKSPNELALSYFPRNFHWIPEHPKKNLTYYTNIRSRRRNLRNRRGFFYWEKNIRGQKSRESIGK